MDFNNGFYMIENSVKKELNYKTRKKTHYEFLHGNTEYRNLYREMYKVIGNMFWERQARIFTRINLIKVNKNSTDYEKLLNIFHKTLQAFSLRQWP